MKRILALVVALLSVAVMAVAVQAPARAAPGIQITGRAVDSRTGNPLAGVRVAGVKVLESGATVRLTTMGVTDRVGRFWITLPARYAHYDGLGIRFNGSRVGYEAGYAACGHGVVRTWGEACSFGDQPGRLWRLGRFRLDRR